MFFFSFCVLHTVVSTCQAAHRVVPTQSLKLGNKNLDGEPGLVNPAQKKSKR